MDMRELKGLEIAARYKLEYKSGLWLVPSQSSPGTKYPVMISPEVSCTCEDFLLRRKPCKHIIAAQIVAARDANPEPGELIVDEIPKRPTYKQDWPAYNRAQRKRKQGFKSSCTTCALASPNRNAASRADNNRTRSRTPFSL